MCSSNVVLVLPSDFLDIGQVFFIFGPFHHRVCVVKLLVSQYPLIMLDFNPFVPNAPFLYRLKTSKNRKVF